MTFSVNLNNSRNSELALSSSKTGLKSEKVTKQGDSKLLNTSLTEASQVTCRPQSQITIGLNKNTILQLQELQEYTPSLLAPQVPQRPEAINLDKEINLNDTPRLGWLIGRDNNLYNSYVNGLSNGAETMKDFSVIVEKTKDNKFIPLAVQSFLQEHIHSFQRGYQQRQKARAATDDPIVHKVLDYIMPKTQARLQLLQDYLASKELEPSEAIQQRETSGTFFSLKEITVKPSVVSDISFIGDANSNADYSKKLLEFLAKDLRWYDWYLRDDASESLEALALTRVYTITS